MHPQHSVVHLLYKGKLRKLLENCGRGEVMYDPSCICTRIVFLFLFYATVYVNISFTLKVTVW